MPREWIKEGWESYREHVIANEATKEQLDECKMAFYAGATWLMHTITSNLSDAMEEEPTETELKMMDEIADELQKFSDATGEGYVP